MRNCVNYMLFNLLFLWFSQVRFLNSLFSWFDDKNCSHRLIIKKCLFVNSRPEVLCSNRVPLPLSEGINPNSLPLNWPPRALPRTRIRACSLAAQRKTASVADTAITAKVHQAFDVHRDFAPEVTLDNEIGNGRSQFSDFGFCQVLHCRLRINAGRGTDLPRS